MRQRRQDEQLSAYIDDELSPKERARLDHQLAVDPKLRAELDALRDTVSLVHKMPSVPIPRNFILSPRNLGDARPRAAQGRSRWAAPLLTAASAVASLLFVITLATSFLAGNAGITGFASAPSLSKEAEAPVAAHVAEPEGDVYENAPAREEQLDTEKAPSREESLPATEAGNALAPSNGTQVSPGAALSAQEKQPLTPSEASNTETALPPLPQAEEEKGATASQPVTRVAGSTPATTTEGLEIGPLAGGATPADEVTSTSGMPVPGHISMFHRICLAALPAILGICALVLVALTVRAWRRRD